MAKGKPRGPAKPQCPVEHRAWICPLDWFRKPPLAPEWKRCSGCKRDVEMVECRDCQTGHSVFFCWIEWDEENPNGIQVPSVVWSDERRLKASERMKARYQTEAASNCP